MRVIQVTRFGAPEAPEWVETPDPAAAPGQAVVDVELVDVLVLDAQLRAGWGGDVFPLEPPYVPGDGVAGRVGSVGDGVDPDWVGRRVVARTGEGGAYAERAVVSADGLVAVPDGLDLPAAAAPIHDGPTALGLVDRARIRPGERVLVVGATGGLGVLLVQLARAVGAEVVAAARGERKLDLARELGAASVVDPTAPDWPERVRAAAGGRGVDVVFDGVGGRIGRAAFETVAPGARFSAHGAPTGDVAEIDPREAERRGVTLRGIEQVRFAPDEARRLTERVLNEMSAGRLRPVIGQTFPLARAADPHAAIESRRVVGKTLLLA